MDSLYYLKVFAAFIFVIALMYLISFAVRRWGGTAFGDQARLKKHKLFAGGDSPLSIVDSTILDYRRRMVLVKYADKGYMVMLGPQSETVVATDIPLEKQDLKNDKD